jgi:hypothetical protein
MPIRKVCETCGSEFFVAPSREQTAKYCSIECKADGQRNGVMRVCETCENEFYATPSRIKSSGARFCSNECKDLAKRKRIYRNCEQCGKRLWVSFYNNKRGRGRFCSVDCMNKWRAENDPRGSDNSFFMQIECVCEQCGKSFYAKKYRVDEGTVHYCSNECRYAAHPDKISGENNGQWRGGKSFEPYPLEFNEQFKKAIRERDGYTCAVCRLSGMDVHHINYVKDDTVPENCITLCRSCHMATNAHREYWQGALEHLMDARWGDQPS